MTDPRTRVARPGGTPTRSDAYGVWGGTTAGERVVLRRARRHA